MCGGTVNGCTSICWSLSGGRNWSATNRVKLVMYTGVSEGALRSYCPGAHGGCYQWVLLHFCCGVVFLLYLCHEPPEAYPFLSAFLALKRSIEVSVPRSKLPYTHYYELFCIAYLSFLTSCRVRRSKTPLHAVIKEPRFFSMVIVISLALFCMFLVALPLLTLFEWFKRALGAQCGIFPVLSLLERGFCELF